MLRTRLPRPDRQRPLPAFRPRLEQLEDRWVPAVVTWINPLGGEWANPLNWDAGRKPGYFDDVVIRLPGVSVRHDLSETTVVRSIDCTATLLVSAGTVAMWKESSIDTLIFSGGTVSSSNKLWLTDEFHWSGGKLAGSGEVHVLGDATWSSIKTKTVDRLDLYLNGTTTWTGGRVATANGALVWNQDDATLTVQGGSRFDPSFWNEGKVVFAAAGTVPFATFENQGEVILDSGVLQASTYHQTRGTTDLSGGKLASGQVVTLDGGVLTGGGTVSGSLLNRAGVVRPGIGQAIRVEGNYTQGASGHLSINVVAPWNLSLLGASLLVVTGTARLDGALWVQVAGVPVVGGRFDVLVANKTSGQFASLQATSVPGLGFSVEYPNDGVDLVAELAAVQVIDEVVPAVVTPVTPKPTTPTSKYQDPSYTNSKPGSVGAAGLTVVSAGTTTWGSVTGDTADTTARDYTGADAIRFLMTPTGSATPTALGRANEIASVSSDVGGSLVYGRSSGAGTALSTGDRGAGTRDLEGLADDVFRALASMTPEVRPPSEEEMLSPEDVAAALVVGARARADILPQGRGQLSVVATVVYGGEAGDGETRGASPLAELLLDPLAAPMINSGWNALSGTDVVTLGSDESEGEPRGGGIPRLWLATAGVLGVVACALVSRERRARWRQEVVVAPS